MAFYCKGKRQICENPTKCSGCRYFDFTGGYNETTTNADRIRAMSDEELKDFLCSILQCEFCKFEGWGGCECLEWLQQKAE